MSPTLLESADIILPSPTHRERAGQLWTDPFSLTTSTILKAYPWKGAPNLALKIPPRRSQLLAACSIWRGPGIRTWGYGSITSEPAVRGTAELRQAGSKQAGLGRGFPRGIFLAALPVSWFWTIGVALGGVLGLHGYCHWSLLFATEFAQMAVPGDRRSSRIAGNPDPPG